MTLGRFQKPKKACRSGAKPSRRISAPVVRPRRAQFPPKIICLSINEIALSVRGIQGLQGLFLSETDSDKDNQLFPYATLAKWSVPPAPAGFAALVSNCSGSG